MNDIDDLISRSAEQDIRKTDTVLPMQGITWVGKKVSFALGEQSQTSQVWGAMGDTRLAPVELTNHAFRQLCTKLGAAVWPRKNKSLPLEFLLALPDEICGESLNWSTQLYTDMFPNKKWLWREYASQPQEGVFKTSVRAVLDGLYPTVSNTELLQASRKMVGNELTYHLVRPHVAADEMNVRLLVRNVGNNYGVGVYIGNSEIGTSKIRIMPFIQRHSCTNSIVNAEGGVELVHRGDIHSLRVQLTSAMAQALHQTGETLDRMLAAELELIPNFSSVLRGLAAQYNWSEEVTSTAFIGCEGSSTRAGLVNAITYAAHTHFEGTQQAEMEILGGAILVAPNSLFEHAARQSRVKSKLVERELQEI